MLSYLSVSPKIKFILLVDGPRQQGGENRRVSPLRGKVPIKLRQKGSGGRMSASLSINRKTSETWR